jgi:hypothetical protein
MPLKYVHGDAISPNGKIVAPDCAQSPTTTKSSTNISVENVIINKKLCEIFALPNIKECDISQNSTNYSKNHLGILLQLPENPLVLQYY